ncbi:chalcone isomerase family protein [Ideonella oryzae]|uniref:Chalcone isomerase family protein n=1 Tax=Ideonella oryzae TaxID=2937441 RepID=A0ABT1BPV6_9BURK|nr:chalcone isomerase family protein [Ideonella oryzae]MCO5978265.1 chalcone isomerase family protein [Ideonella oryzae]
MPSSRRDALLLMLSAPAAASAWAQSQTPANAGTPLEVEGFKFDPTFALGGKPLLLNGAAVSFILSVRTTVVALYLQRKHTTVEGALAEPGPKRLCFYSLRDISAKDLSNTFIDRLRKNATSDEIAGNFIQIAQFGSAFSNRSKLMKGDFVTLDYTPATNHTDMTLNGQHIGETMTGEPFFRMLMKIWMGARVRESTREGLVGQAAG